MREDVCMGAGMDTYEKMTTAEAEANAAVADAVPCSCAECAEESRERGWRLNDGGRADAGFKGSAGDCAVRAAAIATGKPYREVYDEINRLAGQERPRKGRKRSSARNGVHRDTLGKYLSAEGFEWVPTMTVGQGCTVHLRREELPAGTLVVRLSRHFAAVIDGVLHDTYDSSRDGTRCVYGYWRAP